MPELNDLSERERQILRLVARGASNKEIARELYISTNTVKVHLRNIFSKIEVASRTEAAMFAVRTGLVETGMAVPGGDIPAGPTSGPAGGIWRRMMSAGLGFFAVALALLVTAAILVLTGNNPALPETASANTPAPTPLPRWRELAPMPTARSGLAAAAYENAIYAIAGEMEDGVTGVVERYDPETDSWETLASKPVPVADVSAAVIGGKIYVPGGRLSSGEMTDILEIYDPRQDSWNTGASLPVALSAYAMVAFEGKLYLFGGKNESDYMNSVYIYDPALNDWYAGTSMPTARAYAGAAVAGGRIYVMGGFDGDNSLFVNEVYMPNIDIGSENTWVIAANMPEARYAMGVVSVADLIQLIGGIGENVTLNALQFIPQTDEWQQLSPHPIKQPLSHLSLVAFTTHVYSIGGRIENTPTSKNLNYQALFNVMIPLIR